MTGGEDERDIDVDSEAWKQEGSYEAGYTEALSDLHRGVYEGWIEEQSGEFEGMAEFIVDAVNSYEAEAEDDEGVRGRQEIQEKRDDIGEEYQEIDLEDVTYGSKLEGMLDALGWVLGEVDDL